MIERIAVIGAGNGGKASAVEFTLHGKHVRLFEFPEFRANIEGLIENPILTATGAVNGEARLDMVTTDLSKAGSIQSRVGCGHNHGLHPGAGPRTDR